MNFVALGLPDAAPPQMMKCIRITNSFSNYRALLLIIAVQISHVIAPLQGLR